jgi:acylphosphatase
MQTIHLIIKGKVQGVFYRVSAKEKADELNITGSVKNTEEGNVEITASGSQEQIQIFISWCRKGPKNASVTDIITTEQPLQLFQGFTVIRG